MQTIVPIILLMGPSGVGKTTLAEWATEDLQFSHLDFDLWEGDTAEIEPFRVAWVESKQTGSFEKLRKLSEQIIARDDTKGAILSFPSDDMTADLAIYEQAVAVGVYPVILYATADVCREVFVSREAENGRGLPASHWDECNAHIYAPGYLTDSHSPYLVPAYETTGERRSRAALMAELRKRIQPPRV